MTFLDRIAYELGQSWIYKPRLMCWVLKRDSFTFVVPRLYNLAKSGRALGRVCDHFGENAQGRIIIVTHDTTLPIGVFGHLYDTNIELSEALVSCAEEYGTKKFNRFSIGVAAPEADMFKPTILNYLTFKDEKEHARQYEHNKFPENEKKQLEQALYGNLAATLQVLLTHTPAEERPLPTEFPDAIDTLRQSGIDFPYPGRK